MNVAHHSLATMVSVTIDLIDDKLILKVHDNGVGFDQNDPKKKHSFGLTGIKERAVLLNAEIKIESEVGKGTTLTLEMPYQK
jgi:two-component system sensor histidine kinase DegS